MSNARLKYKENKYTVLNTSPWTTSLQWSCLYERTVVGLIFFMMFVIWISIICFYILFKYKHL